MNLTAGTLLEGTVKTITNFGAFVQLPENRVGMIHISEVSFSYIKDIRQVLTEGQTVRVKVLSIDENGKIALSLKRAQEQSRPASGSSAAPQRAPSQKSAPQTFEEKLKQFMSDSDSKLSASRQFEHRSRSPRRR